MKQFPTYEEYKKMCSDEKRKEERIEFWKNYIPDNIKYIAWSDEIWSLTSKAEDDFLMQSGKSEKTYMLCLDCYEQLVMKNIMFNMPKEVIMKYAAKNQRKILRWIDDIRIIEKI